MFGNGSGKLLAPSLLSQCIHPCMHLSTTACLLISLFSSICQKQKQLNKHCSNNWLLTRVGFAWFGSIWGGTSQVRRHRIHCISGEMQSEEGFSSCCMRLGDKGPVMGATLSSHYSSSGGARGHNIPVGHLGALCHTIIAIEKQGITRSVQAQV